MERELRVNLDSIVCDNVKTHELLINIPKGINERSGNYQNIVRKHYQFKNKKFPRLNDFKAEIDK